jgi:hypothetical protein
MATYSLSTFQPRGFDGWMANLFLGDDIQAGGQGQTRDEAIESLAARYRELFGADFDFSHVIDPYMCCRCKQRPAHENLDECLSCFFGIHQPA